MRLQVGRSLDSTAITLAAAIVVAAVTVRAWLARLPEWDPESLWQDDLVSGASTRAPDLATILTLPAHTSPGS